MARAALVKALRAHGEHIVADEVSACCSRVLRGRDLVVRERGGRRYLCGMNHCKRMLCPICGPYLVRQRLQLLRLQLPYVRGTAGLRHFMVTLTLPHGPGTSWRCRVKVLSRMMTALQAGRSWKRCVVGFVRVLETTFGRQGHHPHYHLLVTVRPHAEWAPETFAEGIRRTSDRVAAQDGMDCAFTPGWWSEVDRANLARAVTYLGLAAKWGPEAPRARRKASGHIPPWHMPPVAFAELWRKSRGVRWFASGGCWKASQNMGDGNGDFAHGEPGAERPMPVREAPSMVLLHLPAQVFQRWPRRLRLERLVTIYDPTVPRLDLCLMFMAWGAILGPPRSP